MKRYLIFLFILINLRTNAQIWGDSPRDLPQDLRTETILFLKFDSVDHPTLRPAGMDKKYFERWQYHNQNLTRHNAVLRKLAAKYPFKYKIVSMFDTARYRTYGAKYMLWLNTFDAMTKGGLQASLHGAYRTMDHSPTTELGILDLTCDKQYLLSKSMSIVRSYFYQDSFRKLFYQLEKQFDVKIK
ncbi:hypothetical protein [Chryseosolibacter indicus]|uniref:Uncharacterized protein n=1 Tax=Chryseosolibacter indicus TaxID=2782351 RepID=A0ABS5VWV3_9BACT|nr:hypothetical protein [Chryseosolibacter indicus]MBT1705894.1 hypothetical protein [Chryseosolibacter indicus]